MAKPTSIFHEDMRKELMHRMNLECEEMREAVREDTREQMREAVREETRDAVREEDKCSYVVCPHPV